MRAVWGGRRVPDQRLEQVRRFSAPVGSLEAHFRDSIQRGTSKSAAHADERDAAVRAGGARVEFGSRRAHSDCDAAGHQRPAPESREEQCRPRSGLVRWRASVPLLSLCDEHRVETICSKIVLAVQAALELGGGSIWSIVAKIAKQTHAGVCGGPAASARAPALPNNAEA